MNETQETKPVDPYSARALAPEIAKLLGWKVEPEDETLYQSPGFAVLIEATPTYGYRLTLRSGHDGKIEIHGCAPKFVSAEGIPLTASFDGDVCTSIKVTASRGAEAIVRELQRRLLPAYFKAFREGMLYLEERAKRHNEAVKLARELAGGEGIGQPRGDGYVSFYSTEAGRVEIYPASSKDDTPSIRFQGFSTTAEKAKEILALLAK